MSTTKPDQPETLYAALLDARREFAPLTKGNRANTGKYSYTYADLGSVLDAVIPALNAHGLIITQSVDHSFAGDRVVPMLRTELAHAPSGMVIGGTAPVVCADPNDPQKVGGAITYMRRYALMALLGLNAEDDDAQQASKPRVQHVTEDATTSPEQTRQHAENPASERVELSDAQFDEAVRKALAERNGTRYQDLVKKAGKYTSRWLILIRHAETEAALRWIEDAMPAAMKSTLVIEQIATRRKEISA